MAVRPVPRQRRVAVELLGAGADLVAGHSSKNARALKRETQAGSRTAAARGLSAWWANISSIGGGHEGSGNSASHLPGEVAC
jgi:hypothetical protein